MSLKSLLAKPFAKWESSRIESWSRNPVAVQRQVFRQLISKGQKTDFGQTHRFNQIKSYSDFTQAVPQRNYEALRPWIDRIVKGEPDVLWPGKPLYLAKTSGTTSGTKYIPLTRDSMPNHINTARATLTSYIASTGKSDFVDGKMIFLQGSPVMSDTGGIPTGRLSGIVYHHVPSYLLRNRLPSWETNCIEDWEKKVESVCRETVREDMTLISGIPPWVIMYFEKLLEISGKSSVRALFPRFSLFVHGGVNFKPYKSRLDELIGADVDMLETYPASEGFIAFQDRLDEEGLLLNLSSGIWFQFVPADRWEDPAAPRLSIEEVEIGVNYALLISNNAGLWAYQIGDTIRFTSLDPCRIVVTGRTAHYISAFGEHVIAEEVEASMREASSESGLDVTEFTVAPLIGDAARHQWFVEFRRAAPSNEEVSDFAQLLNRNLAKKNVYYKDLLDGGMLKTAEVLVVRQGGFTDFQRSVGKLGGQNKVARLANDRKIADGLVPFLSS